MPLLILFGLAVFISIFMPGLAEVIANFLIYGFIIPFFTFAGGSLAWALLNIFTGGTFFDAHSWFMCCAFIGFPSGLMMAGWCRA